MEYAATVWDPYQVLSNSLEKNCLELSILFFIAFFFIAFFFFLLYPSSVLDCVHHHDLGHSPAVAEWLAVQSRDEITGTCSRDEILHVLRLAALL